MDGIVIIEIYSNNKLVNTLSTVVASLSYILPKCAKTREPEDEHCVLWCTYINYPIHDPIPLDNPNNHIVLLYITWGSSGILNIREESQRKTLTFFMIKKHGISKLRRRSHQK